MVPCCALPARRGSAPCAAPRTSPTPPPHHTAYIHTQLPSHPTHPRAESAGAGGAAAAAGGGVGGAGARRHGTRERRQAGGAQGQLARDGGHRQGGRGVLGWVAHLGQDIGQGKGGACGAGRCCGVGGGWVGVGSGPRAWAGGVLAGRAWSGGVWLPGYLARDGVNPGVTSWRRCSVCCVLCALLCPTPLFCLPQPPRNTPPALSPQPPPFHHHHTRTHACAHIRTPPTPASPLHHPPHPLTPPATPPHSCTPPHPATPPHPTHRRPRRATRARWPRGAPRRRRRRRPRWTRCSRRRRGTRTMRPARSRVGAPCLSFVLTYVNAMLLWSPLRMRVFGFFLKRGGGGRGSVLPVEETAGSCHTTREEMGARK